MHQQLAFLFSLLFLISCSSSKNVENKLTPEERSIYDLVEKIKSNPSDKELAAELNTAYYSVIQNNQALSIQNYTDGSLGDRWMKIGNEYSKLQGLYEAINAVPAAKKAVPKVVDYTDMVNSSRQNAAAEYYNSGLQYLNYNNRTYAKKAVDMFEKSDKAVKGYQNVNVLLAQSRDLSTLKVIIQAVDYHNHGWNYWGFQNDWLQQRMVQDLNAMSFNETRFYSEWEASSKRIQADRYVSMRLNDLYISNLNTVTNSYNRTAQVETGAVTKSIPPQKVYKTVHATIIITRKTMMGRAELECRIYSVNSGYSHFSDRFPGNYTWESVTATYTGDYKALTPEDRQLINNPSQPNPGRTQIAEKIINDSYFMLLNRIKSGVSFGD